MISIRRWYLRFGAFFSIACATTRSSSPPIPVPTAPSPIKQVPTATATNAGLWSFKYQSGIVNYRIARSATIVRSDTAGSAELSTNASHEMITLDSTESGISFVSVVDSFTTTTQGLIGPVQATLMPVQISGSFAPGGLTLTDQPTNEKCSPVHSVLYSDLYNLLVLFPQQLSPGLVWKDSVGIRGCPAGVPTLSHTTRVFTVTGEVTYEGRPVVLVQRVDTTRAQGDGGLQQHRVSIDAHGTGTAIYYLDASTGRIMHLTINQTLTLGVRASRRQYQLKQDSKQEFEMVR